MYKGSKNVFYTKVKRNREMEEEEEETDTNNRTENNLEMKREREKKTFPIFFHRLLNTVLNGNIPFCIIYNL